MAPYPRRVAFDEDLADRVREVLAELAPEAGVVAIWALSSCEQLDLHRPQNG